MQPENIKKDCAGSKIAKMAPTWPTNQKRQYHAITRAIIANEVFRRVHPSGKTIGEFLRSDLAGPLEADTYIGCTEENYANVSHLTKPFTGLLRNTLGLTSHFKEMSVAGFLAMSIVMKQWAGKPAKGWLAPVGIGGILTELNRPECRSAEMGSVNGNCSARGLAKLAALMANKV